MLASAPRKSGTSPTFQSASPRASKVGSKWLHVKTLLKTTTVHLAHECMKHEAASRCRRWTANRRHLRRLPSSCMPPRRKAEPRQNPPRASGTGGRSIQDIAQPKWKPEIGACGGDESRRQQLWETHPKKRIMAWEISRVLHKKATAISAQMSVSNSDTVPKEAII